MRRNEPANRVYCCLPEYRFVNSPGEYFIQSLPEESLSSNKSFDDVKLSVAKDQVTSRLIHVSERTPSNSVLCCPHCNAQVTRIAGAQRRHHYRHAPGSTCSVNAETLLHEGAKIYLQHALVNGIKIDLLASVALLRKSKITSLLDDMGIDSISIRISSIYSHERATHVVEENFKNLRPDILSYVPGFAKDFIFAWEIFVTHEVDEDKSELFKEYKIPYIELFPIENGKSGYLYIIKSYGGFDLLDSDNRLNAFVKDEYKRELIEIFSNELDQVVFGARLEDEKKKWFSDTQELFLKELDQSTYNAMLEAEKEKWQLNAQNKARQHFESEIQNKINSLTLADVLNLPNAFSTIIYPITQSLIGYDKISTNDSHWVNIKECDFEKYNDIPYMVLRTPTSEKYLFLSALGMLRGIYQKLASIGMLVGVLSVDETSRDEVLVGAKLYISLPTCSNPIERNSLLYKYRNVKATSEIEIRETMSKKSKTSGKFYMYVNDGIFVDSYDYQLKNIIYNLQQYFTLEAHLGTNSQNKQRVDAIRIRGLCDLDVVKDFLSMRLSR